MEWEVDGVGGRAGVGVRGSRAPVDRPPRPPERGRREGPGAHDAGRGRGRRLSRPATSRATPTRSAALFAAVYRDVAAGATVGAPDVPDVRRRPRRRRSCARPIGAVGPVRRVGRASIATLSIETTTKEHDMKLGLLTAAFPDTPLTEVADWAAGNGFSMLEVACWPRADGPTRRYAGVSHIDCADLSDDQAKDLVGDLAERGIEISGARLLPEPAAPRSRPPRRGDRPPRPRDRGRRQARRAGRQHVHRQRQGQAARRRTSPSSPRCGRTSSRGPPTTA